MKIILKHYGVSLKEIKITKKEHTLYSFRHTGAINVFEKNG